MTPSPRPTRSRCSSPTCAASSRPKASPVCCTPSEGPATSSGPEPAGTTPPGPGVPEPTPPESAGPGGSLRNLARRINVAFDRLPIRTRLALASALLTFVILCGFALVVGSLTVHRIRSDFNTEVAASADDLSSLLQISVRNDHLVVAPNIDEYAAPEHAVIRVILSSSASVIENTPHAPELDPPDGRIAGLEGGVNVDG